MTLDDEETSPSRKRSATDESRWVSAVATIGAMASIPFLLRHVANIGQPAVAPDANRAALLRDPAFRASLRSQN